MMIITMGMDDVDYWHDEGVTDYGVESHDDSAVDKSIAGAVDNTKHRRHSKRMF